MGKILAVALVATALFLPAPPAAALENEDLLALVAMPLAVAAVSEVTDVPMSDLIDVVTLLNDAAVPPAQFVEVVRYVPVAVLTVEPERPRFVEFVRVSEREGLRGLALVTAIENELHRIGVPDAQLNVVAPRLVLLDDRDRYIPVTTRTAARRDHPHGGPPGQLKKELGLQTGAEVVHGTTRGPVAKARPIKESKVDAKPARGKSGNQGGGQGQGKGHGKGKGKG